MLRFRRIGADWSSTDATIVRLCCYKNHQLKHHFCQIYLGKSHRGSQIRYYFPESAGGEKTERASVYVAHSTSHLTSSEWADFHAS